MEKNSSTSNNVMFFGPSPGPGGPGGPMGPGPGGPGGPGGPMGPGPGPGGPGGGWFGRHGGPWGAGMGPRGPMMGSGMMGPGMWGMPGADRIPRMPMNPGGPMGIGPASAYGPYGPGPWGWGPGKGPGGHFGWGSLGHPRGWMHGWFGLFPLTKWYPGRYFRRPLPGTQNPETGEFADPIPREKSLFARFRDWFRFNFWL